MRVFDKLCATFLCAVCAIPVVAASTMKVDRFERPLPAADVSGLGGFVGERVRLNDINRLSKFNIDQFIRMLEDKRHRDWWWIGEQPGKWLEAAVYSSEETGDAALRAKTEEMLARMVAAQEPSGYLGITDPAVRNDKQPIRGMDPYELYFTIHALITANVDLGSAPALDSARKLADFFVERFGPGKVEFWPDNPVGADPKTVPLWAHSLVAGHSVHRGLEGTLLTDPIMRLYAVTGDRKYLDWCKTIVANIDKWTGCNTFSNLDKVADGKMTIDQVQPYVHAHTFQMNFLAFLRLYEATGDKSYLRKVEGAVKDIMARQMYITGAVSVGEHYEGGHNLPNSGMVVETCASMSWIELCQSLLELTGDPKYADAIERLMLNHLFAAQTSDGDGFRYHTPLNGTKPQGYWTGPDCCSSSGARIIAKLPKFIYASSANGVYVNQFVQSTGQMKLFNGHNVTLRQTTDFPEGETVRISVSPAAKEKFALNIRIPNWCAQPTLRVNGKSIANAKPGTYAAIRRTWAPGDSLELRLPMEPKWVKGEYTNDGLWCLTRGPVVYALDSVWYTPQMRAAANGAASGDDAASLGGVVIDLKSASASIEKCETPAGAMGPAYKVPLILPDGTRSSATMTPFANVGRWYADENEHKNPTSVAHGYAVWLADSESAALKAEVSSNQSRARMRPRIVDEVNIANDKAFNPQGVEAGGGIFRGHAWKGAFDKWLSWDLKVIPDAPMTLMCTYWGDEEGRRNFGILIDGQKVGSQRLLHNKPGVFFEVEYPIPESLTKGKSKVTVRFQSIDGEGVGGVFGCAMLKANAGE